MLYTRNEMCLYKYMPIFNLCNSLHVHIYVSMRNWPDCLIRLIYVKVRNVGGSTQVPVRT